MLGKLGFNRMSVGIQDFDPKVQAAVNRIQSYDETKEVIDAAREAEFKSVSVDLIYGLPHQTAESIKTTIDTVFVARSRPPCPLSLRPPAAYLQAATPHRYRSRSRQRRKTRYAAIPCVQTLTERGYVFIGMDHFAKPDDELSIALKEGFLQRNFQATRPTRTAIWTAIGVSSIGKIGSTYPKTNATSMPTMLPSMPDTCPSCAATSSIRTTFAPQYHPRFDVPLRLGLPNLRKRVRYPVRPLFQRRTADLEQLASLGLVRLKPHGMTVTPKGRFPDTQHRHGVRPPPAS